MNRIRIGNRHMELSFNNFTGELLELINRTNGENFLKNWSSGRSMPFALVLSDSDGDKYRVCAPVYKEILEEEDYKPKFLLEKLDDGTKKLQIDFQYLKSPKGKKNIHTVVQITIPVNDCESLWKIFVENNEEGVTVETVQFPCFFGMYIGDTWEDDTLVYPFNAGLKIENPVETFVAPSKSIGWKWQEYKYTYFLDNYFTPKAEDGAFVRELQYSGPVSMGWMDYYGENEGFYIASYDEEFRIAGLHCETFGPEKPGMGFYIVKYPEITHGKRWESSLFGVAVHSGDWHWGADRYREWREGINNGPKAELPEWFIKSAGLIAHYDFKYQSGEIVHRFCDIPRLFDEAKEMGVNHLLISGWHKDGFDNGFPNYTPDPDLGTEEEFIEQIQNVAKAGGHVSFYINTRLFNEKYCKDDELNELKNTCIVRTKKDEPKIESYGDSSLKFAILCAASKGWQEYLENTVKYLIDVVGADGMYLDQLAMGSPEFCYSSKHSHEFDWNHGYGQFLNRLNMYYTTREDSGRKPIGIIYEGVSDIHGHKAGGQLISTFFYHHFGAFPELYRYTFPEQVLVDMVYPSKGQVMRPVHVSQVSRDMIDRAFLTGCYLWIYDLEEDNTFGKDPDMQEYLKAVITLRKMWLDKFGAGIYMDDQGIITEGKNLKAKIYRFEGSDRLITLCNRLQENASKIRVDTCEKEVEYIQMYRLRYYDEPVLQDFSYEIRNGVRYIVIKADSAELSLLYIKFK